MTAGSQAPHDGADLFVADFYPKLGEYLAEQHAAGYDAGPGGPVSGPGSASTRKGPPTTTRSVST